ncbi:MAG: hypothetical protein M3Q56_10790 [Bacteroidota bacterium]|nr:hypothetical protein [Bacteroidota bacterium]
MVNIVWLITTALLFLSCDRPNSGILNNQKQEKTLPADTRIEIELNRYNSSIYPHLLFTIPEAENILEKPAHLSDSAAIITADGSTYNKIEGSRITNLKNASTKIQ